MPRVIRRQDLVHWTDLFGRGLLLSLVALLCILLTSMVTFFWKPTLLVPLVSGGLFGCVVPVWLVTRKRHQIGSFTRAFVSGMGFGAGLVITPVIVLWWFAIMQNDILPGALIATAMGAGVSQVTGVIAIVTWFVVRHTASAAVIQDGTLCPDCAYCLVGNVSRVCPECGRPFTYEELDTTAAEFKGRMRDGGNR